MAKQTVETREVVGARWLGQHSIHLVPARNLSKTEWELHIQTILESEAAVQQQIYERIYAQGSN